jgi:hypothetical protein
MEVAHSRVSSIARNVIVRYSDDIDFDYENYIPIEDNPHKHEFFKMINIKNDRMQHLALLTRYFILTRNNYDDIQANDVSDFIDAYQREDGVGRINFDNSADNEAFKSVLKYLNIMCGIFKESPTYIGSGKIPEFRTEYFTISSFLLLKHIVDYYSFTDVYYEHYEKFIYVFYQRWRERKENDADILMFSDYRQQDTQSIEIRDRIMRQSFFEYLTDNNVTLKLKSTYVERRSFSEAERIKIYRNDNGICKMCYDEYIESGLSEEEATKASFVEWSKFEADHILPYIEGGETKPWNGQVLCATHNQQKGSKIS